MCNIIKKKLALQAFVWFRLLLKTKSLSTRIKSLDRECPAFVTNTRVVCSLQASCSALVSDDKPPNQLESVYRGKKLFSKPILIQDDVSKNNSLVVLIMFYFAQPMVIKPAAFYTRLFPC